MSSTGPVNWELARQVGIATASWGAEDPHPTEDERAELEQTVRAAELAVADLTALPAPADVSACEAVRRAQWVEASIASLRTDRADRRDALDGFAQRAAGRGLPGAPGHAGDGVGCPATSAGEDAAHGQRRDAEPGARHDRAAADGRAGRHRAGRARASACSASSTSPSPGRPAACRSSSPTSRGSSRSGSCRAMEFRAWVALHEVTHRFEFAAAVGSRALPRPGARPGRARRDRPVRPAAAAGVDGPLGPERDAGGDGGRRQPVRRGDVERAAPADRAGAGVRRGGGGLRRPRHRDGRAHDAVLVREDRRGRPAIPRGPPRRPGARAAAGPADDRRAAPARPGVLRHGRRADRPRPRCPGCGARRTRCPRCPSWRNRPSGWREWPDRPPFSSILQTVPIGDLVFANVIDAASRAAQGDMGQSSCTSARSPDGRSPSTSSATGRRRPGYVTEEIELISPAAWSRTGSGRRPGTCWAAWT